MAMATAKCTCKKCGEEFEIYKKCYNRRDADEFEEYAAAHYTECRKCYRARVAAQNADKAETVIEKYNMPTITGVSEKQINYANTLRNRFLANISDSKIEKAIYLISDDRCKQKMQELADKRFNGDLKKARFAMFFDYGLDDNIAVLLTESNAGKIIDALKY